MAAHQKDAVPVVKYIRLPLSWDPRMARGRCEAETDRLKVRRAAGLIGVGEALPIEELEVELEGKDAEEVLDAPPALLPAVPDNEPRRVVVP